MRWFILVLAATMAGLGIDFLAAKATNVDDEVSTQRRGVAGIIVVEKGRLLSFLIFLFLFFPLSYPHKTHRQD